MKLTPMENDNYTKYRFRIDTALTNPPVAYIVEVTRNFYAARPTYARGTFRNRAMVLSQSERFQEDYPQYTIIHTITIAGLLKTIREIESKHLEREASQPTQKTSSQYPPQNQSKPNKITRINSIIGANQSPQSTKSQPAHIDDKSIHSPNYQFNRLPHPQTTKDYRDSIDSIVHTIAQAKGIPRSPVDPLEA